LDWRALIDEGGIAALLSAEAARFARPIRESLALFLAGLPDPDQHAILAAQTRLPATAGTPERLGALVRQCPVLHKLGQTLARDRRLEPRLRRELRTLEVLPCSVPMAALRAGLQGELGSLEGLAIELDAAAIAEASVAVVIGYRDRDRTGVLKLLKPGIEERLERELELLGQVGVHLDARCAELGIPRLGYEEAFRQVRDKLRDEVRLPVEQRHLTLAARQYANDPHVLIPALHPYCTRRVTAMERIDGRKVTDVVPGTASGRRRLASLVATALLVRPLFASGEEVLVHGDPHAGNLLVTPRGRLALLDWSLASRLSQGHREALVQVLVGALLLDERRVVAMLSALAEGAAPDTGRLVEVVRRRLGEIRAGRPPDFAWVVGMMDEAVRHAGLRAGSDLLLFRKSLHTIEGVVEELAPGHPSVDEAFFSDCITRLALEWPQRWLAAPHSRAFPSRLSNMDLTRLMVGLPFTATRIWLGQARGD
jgi:ubiquinone biosynthesis protein